MCRLTPINTRSSLLKPTRSPTSGIDSVQASRSSSIRLSPTSLTAQPNLARSGLVVLEDQLKTRKAEDFMTAVTKGNGFLKHLH